MPHMQISIDPRHTQLAMAFMQPPKAKKRLPSQANPIAQQRAFGQQGQRMRNMTDKDLAPVLPDTLQMRQDFMRSPQGQEVLKRIVKGFGPAVRRPI